MPWNPTLGPRTLARPKARERHRKITTNCSEIRPRSAITKQASRGTGDRNKQVAVSPKSAQNLSQDPSWGPSWPVFRTASSFGDENLRKHQKAFKTTTTISIL